MSAGPSVSYTEAWPDGMPGTTTRVIPISPPQNDVLRSTDPITGYVGGRGSGKTWIGAYKIESQAQPGDPWLCVSPDAGVVHDTTLPTFLEICQNTGSYRRHVLSPYPRVWWQPRGHGPDAEPAQMVFRSGEKPDKLRGPNKAGLWIDEASIQPEDVFLIARATLRYQGKMGPTLFSLTPRGRQHWTFDVFYRRLDQSEIDDLDAIAQETGTAPAYEIIQGVAYQRRPGRNLIQASTRQNPFLPAEFHDELSQNYSSILAEQELEGRFVDIAGLMFRREWFQPVDFAPRDALRVRYWDRAASVLESSSYTAGVLIARDPQGIYYIEDIVRGQWTPHDRDTVILQTAQADAAQYQGEVRIYAEQEGGSGGKEVMQQLIRKLAGFPVYRDLASASGTRSVGGQILPGGPKITRAQPLAAQAEAGNVRLVRGRWNNDFLSELTAFPESSHSDQVDASAAGLNRLAAITQPENVVASKDRIGVNSARFGKTVAPDRGTGRRKLFGRS